MKRLAIAFAGPTLCHFCLTRSQADQAVPISGPATDTFPRERVSYMEPEPSSSDRHDSTFP
jgi:hypothetical protein